MTIPELTLTGPARERGRAHGEALRDLIAETIEGWFEALAERTDPREFTAEILGASGLREAAEEHTGDLLEEVRGIAEGAGQRLEAMFAWQLIDECWWYLDELCGELRPSEACSAMAVNSGGRGIVAQTQDLYRHSDGSQVMLRYLEPDGLEILAPSAAGLLAYNGVNSAGLAVCITTLSELAHQSVGVSSGFVMPALLRCRSVDEALAWLESVPLASGNSWTLGSRDRSLAVEASASGVSVVQDGSRALHTNHALVQAPVYEYLQFAGSVERLDQLEAAVRPDSTLADIEAVYSGGAVCRSRSSAEDMLNVGTMIFELGDSQRCHYAPGPLDSDELIAYEMSLPTQNTRP